MKTHITGILLAAITVTQMAAVEFDLSPSGTDSATGLSPANVVPAVTNGNGSGDEISGGINFDPTNRVLNLAVGYGSAAGFSNLTAAATAVYLHGPATTGTTAVAVWDLSPFVFPANDPAQGGVVFGSMIVPTNDVPDLLAGLYYLNIYTAQNTNGEIRGQLVVRRTPNNPPTVECPPPMTVECKGRPLTIYATVRDPEGDALTVVWRVNGAPVQTNLLPANCITNRPGATNLPPARKVSLSAEFPLGTNKVEVSVSDRLHPAVTCETSLVVVDRVPPAITYVSATPSKLWPPNHKMQDVKLKVVVKDACGANWKILSVSSNEPVDGLGDGDTAPDWEIVGDQGLRLRAERSGKGKGRTYTIKVQAQDGGGNRSGVSCIYVTVPKSQGK